MVERALGELEAKKTCSSTKCTADRLAIRFQSTPNKVREHYSDKAECAAFFEQTSEQPLSFPEQQFSSAEALSEWIGEFSQGKGTLGNELYERCPGSCSPRFTYYIQRKTTGDTDSLTVRPSVVCGHARDKSDNQYQLEYELVCLE